MEQREYVRCPTCGNFSISDLAYRNFDRERSFDARVQPFISHSIRRMQASTHAPFISRELMDRLLADPTLPSPSEQAHTFIRWIGDELRAIDPAQILLIDSLQVAAIIGATGDGGLKYVLQGLDQQGLVRTTTTAEGTKAGLTFGGWDRYYELAKAHNEGPIAFMAMKFGDEQLDKMFFECFKPAVKLAGFDLRRLDESPEAGLIDNRLRVEIRKARFLVADLTFQNAGAYWEAGYAEGLGKPVIYTCEHAYFKARGSHFDTNHHFTVLWSVDDIQAAADQLKTTVRATLPEEARLSDD